MMRNIHCTEIRQIIADVLRPTIEEYRLNNDEQFFYEFDVEPTDDEVDEFIISSIYFDDWIKSFLLRDVGYWLLDDKDVKEFKNNLILLIEKCNGNCI